MIHVGFQQTALADKMVILGRPHERKRAEIRFPVPLQMNNLNPISGLGFVFSFLSCSMFITLWKVNSWKCHHKSSLKGHLSKSVISHLFLCTAETCKLNERSYSSMDFNSQTPPQGPGYCTAQADAHTVTGSSLVMGGLAALLLVWAAPRCKVVMCSSPPGAFIPEFPLGTQRRYKSLVWWYS